MSMQGYNRVEQSVGTLLRRFPRLKDVIEAGYQRTAYTLFADSDFSYSLHDDASIQSVGERFDGPAASDRFVGFYDISPWDSSMNRLLVHDRRDSEINIRVLQDSDEPIIIGTTQAWNYQQGSRLQWHPTEPDTVLFNDIRDGSAVCRVCSLGDSNDEILPKPIQAVNPVKEGYLSINYRRMDRNSPGYGYGTDDGSELEASGEDGLWWATFDGEYELIISLADLIDESDTTVSHERHYLHHALFNPSGSRFVVLHRWKDGERRYSRLIVGDTSGEWETLFEHPELSHFCWLDDQRLFLSGGSPVHGRGYHTVDVTSGHIDYVEGLDGFGDGHPSRSPDGKWIVTDTYPNRLRKRFLTLYNLEEEEPVQLGAFLAPFEFDGATRCDLHPRWSPDGRFVSIDSAHTGLRESYLVNVEDIVR